MGEPKRGVVVTVPAEDNPCGHTDARAWEFCPDCQRAAHENGIRRMREAGERFAAEYNRRWWEAFLKAFNAAG